MKNLITIITVLLCNVYSTYAQELKIKPLSREEYAKAISGGYSDYVENWLIILHIEYNDTTRLYSTFAEHLEYFFKDTRNLSYSEYQTLLYNAVYTDTLHVNKKEDSLIKYGGYFHQVKPECINSQEINAEREIKQLFNENGIYVCGGNTDNPDCALYAIVRKRYLLKFHMCLGIMSINGMSSDE